MSPKSVTCAPTVAQEATQAVVISLAAKARGFGAQHKRTGLAGAAADDHYRVTVEGFALRRLERLEAAWIAVVEALAPGVERNAFAGHGRIGERHQALAVASQR